MKWSNAQYTWFLIYLTEQSLFTLYRMWRHQIIATYPCKHQSLCEATISVLGMIRRILGKQIILQTSTLVTTEEPHRCYSDNHLHFFIRLLLYSFRGGEIFWSMTCWSALSESHCNPFHSRHCQMPMDGSGSWSALSSSRISYLPHFYGSRLCCARIVRINDQIHQMKHLWWSLFPYFVLNTLL